MRYNTAVSGTFLDRPNRFIAVTEIDGVREIVHVKNTGRCRELLRPGCSVILEKVQNPNRKTQYDLIAVEKAGRWVNIDSQAPNMVFREWIAAQPMFADGQIQPEYRYGDSRVDFAVFSEGKKYLMEVKGVTLEWGGIACFPDAPTERGRKHLLNLMRAVDEGWDCTAVFVVQMEGMSCVIPNRETDFAFTETLIAAEKAGVKLMGLCCGVEKDALTILGKLPVYTEENAWEEYCSRKAQYTVHRK